MLSEPNMLCNVQVLKATGGDGVNKKILFNVLMALFFPKLAKLLKLSFFDKEALLFFADVVKKAVAHRRENKVKRGDLIDLVLEALEASENAPKEVEDDQFEKDAVVDSGTYKIAADEIELLLISNAIVLFFAGFDTTSTSLAVTFGFLAKHQDIQEKLYQEINDAMEKEGSKTLDYQTVQTLPYLDQVFNETLRFYFTSVLERQCCKDYKLPGSDFVVPKGMLVQIPSRSMHHDDRFWPDASNFNPDVNFSPETKKERSPYAFMSFGHGPRNCIGMRLAYLMAKMCLVNVVSKFKIVSGPKMPEDFVMGATSLNGIPKGGIWCKVERRTT